MRWMTCKHRERGMTISQVTLQVGIPCKELTYSPEGARKSNEGSTFAQPTVISQEQALSLCPALPQIVDCFDLMLVQVRTMLLQEQDFLLTLPHWQQDSWMYDSSMLDASHASSQCSVSPLGCRLKMCTM